MHPSRMRTDCWLWLTVPRGGRGGGVWPFMQTPLHADPLPPKAGPLTRQTSLPPKADPPPKAEPPSQSRTPPCEQNDRRLWKHYLPPYAVGNKSLSLCQEHSTYTENTTQLQHLWTKLLIVQYFITWTLSLYLFFPLQRFETLRTTLSLRGIPVNIARKNTQKSPPVSPPRDRKNTSHVSRLIKHVNNQRNVIFPITFRFLAENGFQVFQPTGVLC